MLAGTVEIASTSGSYAATETANAVRPLAGISHLVATSDPVAARMIGGEPGRVPAGYLTEDNWLSAPYSPWSFQHVEDFVPTAVISRGTGPVAAVPAASAPVAEIPVTSADGVATTVGAVMAATATDGWAVAYRGSMVAEEYFDGLEAQTRHLLFSVSKSLVAAVVGALHGAGAIELDRRSPHSFPPWRTAATPVRRCATCWT